MLVRSILVCAALLSVARPGHADTDAAVLAFGDRKTIEPLVRHAEGWMRAHGHRLAPAGLPTDARSLVRDCLAVDDQACARRVIEQQSTVHTVLVALTGPGEPGEITLGLYWFTKDHPPVAERRVCEDCTAEVLGTLADGMLGRLAGSQATLGTLKLQTRPPGITVVLDGTAIGETPIEREVAAGTHQIVLRRAGQKVGGKTIRIASGETTVLDLPVSDRDDASSSRALPITLMTLGVAGIATGTVLYVYGSKQGADEKYIYDDTRVLGGVLGLVGVGAAITGTVLLVRAGASDATPVAGVGAGGGYVGWAGRF